jgi:hypothetical protein
MNLLLGLFESPVSGAAIPNPSVALWAANPIMSIIARPKDPDAYDWPIASPSLKLCAPMPMAIIIESL